MCPFERDAPTFEAFAKRLREARWPSALATESWPGLHKGLQTFNVRGWRGVGLSSPTWLTPLAPGAEMPLLQTPSAGGMGMDKGL
jgi:hypothetical protein